MDEERRQQLVKVQAEIAGLTARLNALQAGDFHLPAEGFRIGSIRLHEILAGIFEVSGLIRLHYGTSAERIASTDYEDGVGWWESDNHDFYIGNGTAWQLIGGASGPPPGLHAATHQDGGADEINVGGLSGVLTENQPSDHATPIAAHAANADAHHAKVHGAAEHTGAIIKTGTSLPGSASEAEFFYKTDTDELYIYQV